MHMGCGALLQLVSLSHLESTAMAEISSNGAEAYSRLESRAGIPVL
jgi:hypothetical protein